MSSYDDSQQDRNIIINGGIYAIGNVVNAACEVALLFDDPAIREDWIRHMTWGEVEHFAKLALAIGRGDLGQQIILDWAEADEDITPDLADDFHPDVTEGLTAWGIQPRLAATPPADDEGQWAIVDDPRDVIL